MTDSLRRPKRDNREEMDPPYVAMPGEGAVGMEQYAQMMAFYAGKAGRRREEINALYVAEQRGRQEGSCYFLLGK
jgi:hypothetical protein